MEKERLVTVKELSEILNVPISWIYRKTSMGAIPMIKVGKYVRFNAEEVIKSFQNGIK